MKRKSDFQKLGDITQHKRACCAKYSNNSFSEKELLRHHSVFSQYMATENFDKIKKYFSRFSQENLEYFFEQRGLTILSWEMNVKNNGIDRIDFIFNNIPHEAIKKVLYQRECHILKSFLDILLQRESRGADSDEIRRVGIAKFEFMIHFVGRSKLEEIFSEKNVISKKIVEDFKKAGNKYNPQAVISLNSQPLRIQ